MDPLSITASALTLLAAASESCKSASKLYRQLSNAPADIREQSVSLEALSHTFGRLLTLLKDLPPPVVPSSTLVERLQEFLADIREAQIVVEEFNSLLGQGRARETLARVKWTATSHGKVKIFSRQTKQWNAIFMAELHATQIGMLQLLVERSATNPGARQVPVCHRIPLNPDAEAKQANRWQDRTLSSFVYPAGIQTFRSVNLALPFLSIDLEGGPVILKRLSRTCSEVYEIQLQSLGSQLSFTFQTKWTPLFKATLVAFAYKDVSGLGGWWMSTKLRFFSPIAEDSPSFKAARTGNVDAMCQLLASGRAGLSDMTMLGDSLLHVAVQHQMYHMVSFLLKTGAEVNESRNDGATPLHLATRSKLGLEIAKLLISNGADINRQDFSRRTPLHHFFGPTMKALLLEPGLDTPTNAKDHRGMTIAHYVAWTSRSTQNDLSTVLERSHVNITELDDSGRSVLHLAAQCGNLGLMSFLLETEYAEPLGECDLDGRSPLHYATQSSRTEDAIEMLIGCGFKIDAKDNAGCTTLHSAAACDNAAAIKKLISLGANVEARNLEGQTPLQVALAWRAHAAVEYLRQFEAVPTMESATQRSEQDAQLEACRSYRIRPRLHGVVSSETMRLVIIVALVLVWLSP
ncbi:ankyrin [Thozetella sp. PMI_491]|nr:ankyrin [Thozetella sp. PMI_491]